MELQTTKIIQKEDFFIVEEKVYHERIPNVEKISESIELYLRDNKVGGKNYEFYNILIENEPGSIAKLFLSPDSSTTTTTVDKDLAFTSDDLFDHFLGQLSEACGYSIEPYPDLIKRG